MGNRSNGSGIPCKDYWFEVARIHFLDEIGHPYKELEENGYFLPVLECSASFKQAAHFDDKLIIEMKVSFPSMLKLSAEYCLLGNIQLLLLGKPSMLLSLKKEK